MPESAVQIRKSSYRLGKQRKRKAPHLNFKSLLVWDKKWIRVSEIKKQ